MNNSKAKKSLLLLIPAVLVIYFGLRLYHDPIDTYTWTELLINYAAGFIRRGLIGRVAYLISPYLSAKFFLSALIICCYLLQIYLFQCLTQGINGFEWLLFVFSPTTFLFPIYNFEAYGRKDVFLVVIFLLSFLMILKNVRLSRLFPLVLMLYQIGILIHEYTIFYFPFVIVLTLVTYRERQDPIYRWILPLSALFLLGNLALLFGLSRRYYNLDLIPASWEGLIPEYDLTPQSGAFGWMGVPLREGLQPVFNKLTYPQTFFSYVIGFVLSLIPMALLNTRYQLTHRVMKLYMKEPLWCFVFICLIFSSGLIFLFSSDWGRLIYLYGFNVFVGMSVLKQRLNVNVEEPESFISGKAYDKVVGWAFLLLFAGTWFVKFYVDGGHIALQQGLLFRLLEWIAI